MVIFHRSGSELVTSRIVVTLGVEVFVAPVRYFQTLQPISAFEKRAVRARLAHLVASSVVGARSSVMTLHPQNQ